MGIQGILLKKLKHSPLKAPPLRNPGQSLDEQRHDLLLDKVLMPMMFATFFIMIAMLEWFRFFYPQPQNPVLFTVVAFVAIGYAAYRIQRVRSQLNMLRLGRDGEKAVGQFLEHLREDGYQVFHDLVGKGFNIDHVLIGPTGVFTIETKTISKKRSPQAKVNFDGERILVDGYEPDRNPVIQAKAQAGWLRTLLAESTGRDLPSRPVILFPGWFVEQGKGATREVWVLEPKALRAFLQQQPVLLAADDVKLASFHLSRFIRGTEARV